MGGFALILAATFAGFPPAARPCWDLDGDGIAETLPAHTYMADLNGDGSLELLRCEGAVLTITGYLSADSHVIELAEPIRHLLARDIDDDGQPDVEITLASGARLTLKNDGLPWNASPGHGRCGNGPPTRWTADCADLVEIWNSGADLDNVWAAAAGDFDSDGKVGILVPNWPTPRMQVYENDADDSFTLVFTTPNGDAPPGAYVTVTGGDSDLDNQGELIGGETSTLNQIFLYEATGDDTYAKRDINVSEPDFSGQLSMGKVRVADADADGKMEIIFDTSSSTSAGSKLFVYEHSGAVGDNTYTKVYTYSTVSYLFNWTIGDSDNDGNQEIVLGFGGWGGYPVNLRRLENTGDNSFEHKMVQPGGTGLALAPTVADIDLDGQNELVFAGAVSDQGGGLFIYEATADDAYTLAYAEGGLDGNGLASAVGNLHCGPDPIIAVGSFDAQLDLWKYNGTTYERAIDSPITPQGAVRALGIGLLDGDSKPDLFFSSHGADDRIYVYEAVIPGDLNGDGCVDQADLGILLADWGCTGGDCPGDCDGDGDTDQADLGVLLAHWGEGCP